MILVIYTDDTIVTGDEKNEVDKAIQDIGNVFEITLTAKVEDFLAEIISRDEEEVTVTFTQPQLVNSILEDLGLTENSHTKVLPALTTKILHRYENSTDHVEKWIYGSVVGKLNYLVKCIRPGIEYAFHQCARFAAFPKDEHSKAIKIIGRYLLGAKEKGIICDSTLESVIF